MAHVEPALLRLQGLIRIKGGGRFGQKRRVLGEHVLGLVFFFLGGNAGLSAFRHIFRYFKPRIMDIIFFRVDG